MHDGTVETTPDGNNVLRFERRLAHPIDAVWAAITEPAHTRDWWGEADVDLREGGAFVVRWLNTDDDGNSAVMHATIAELDPPRVLELHGDIHGVLRWELSAEGDDTVLRFSSVLPALDDEMRSKVLAGWHIHLDFLAEALEGESVDWERWPRERWQEHHDRYAAAAAG